MKWFQFVQLSMSFSLTLSAQLQKNFNDKRDITISYASTDIGSEGTHAKTVTYIKNFSDKDNAKEIQDLKKLKLAPIGFHGKLPDVPDDIDELFDYVKNKEKPPSSSTKKQSKEIPINPNSNSNKNNEKPLNSKKPEVVIESNLKSKTDDKKVEKIFGDVELIGVNTKNSKIKSQSLGVGKYSTADSHQIEFYRNPNDKPIRDSNNKKKSDYVQSYSYNAPNSRYSPLSQSSIITKDTNYQSKSSVMVTTPSGRTYDIPIPNTTTPSPYVAPNNYKRTNSINKNGNNQRQPFPTSSQRPYIAPKLRITAGGGSGGIQSANNNNQISSTPKSNPSISSNGNANISQSNSNFKLSINNNNNNNYQPKNFRSRGLRN